jgi:hypothetical protein
VDTSNLDRLTLDGYEKRLQRESAPKIFPGGQCYLTTACVDAMGFPDNCFELETLRGFRKIIKSTQTGSAVIADYEAMAPEIVQALNEKEGINARCAWRGLYREIRKAVELVNHGDFKSAFNHYLQMTSRLKNKYID